MDHRVQVRNALGELKRLIKVIEDMPSSPSMNKALESLIRAKYHLEEPTNATHFTDQPMLPFQPCG